MILALSWKQRAFSLPTFNRPGHTPAVVVERVSLLRRAQAKEVRPDWRQVKESLEKRIYYEVMVCVMRSREHAPANHIFVAGLPDEADASGSFSGRDETSYAVEPAGRGG